MQSDELQATGSDCSGDFGAVVGVATEMEALMVLEGEEAAEAVNTPVELPPLE